MEEIFVCPDCSHELTCEKGCGSVCYFCDHCKKLISSKKIVIQEKSQEGK